MPKIIKNGVTYIGTSDNAAAVSYSNTSSGLAATDVQGAIDEVSTELGSTLKQAVIDAIYPVGSIYMSVSSTNPGTTFGVGTWEAWGSGKVPVGVNTSDTSFNTVEKTGGHKSNSYTPAGTNSGCAVTKHTYTPAGTNSGCAVTKHTYTPAGTNSGCAVTKHTYTPDGTVGNTTLKVSQIPSHTHKTCVEGSNAWGLTGTKDLAAGTGRYGIMSAELAHVTDAVTGATGGGGSHTHTFTGTAASLTHTVTQPKFTGTQASLTHTVTQPTFTGTQASLTHTVTQPTFTGTAANISTVQPYITCYMWKRTA